MLFWPLAVGRWPLAVRLKSFLSGFIKNSAVSKIICRFLSFVKLVPESCNRGTKYKSEETFNENSSNNNIKSLAAKAALPLQKGENFGFTLIELLVVVIIIGILAAIAIPQYQKAVFKSRVASVLPELRRIAEAEEMFYLMHGYYTNVKEELDINFPASNSKIGWSLGNRAVIANIYDKDGGAPVGYFFTNIPEPTITEKPGRFYCNGYNSAFLAQICASMGTPILSWTPHYTYF